MRLHTLPASAAGVLFGTGLAMGADHFRWLPALLCLLFAAVAQIGCNFANEYYDFVAAIDRPGLLRHPSRKTARAAPASAVVLPRAISSPRRCAAPPP